MNKENIPGSDDRTNILLDSNVGYVASYSGSLIVKWLSFSQRFQNLLASYLLQWKYFIRDSTDHCTIYPCLLLGQNFSKLSKKWK